MGTDRFVPTAASTSQLVGRTVVVTRAVDQAPDLVVRLERHGARVVVVPVIETTDPSDGGHALRDAIARLGAGDYRWVVAGSPNAAKRLTAMLRDPDDLGGAQVCAVGPATAEVLSAAGLQVDLMPPNFVAESVLEVMAPPDRHDPAPRILIPRAAVARDVLPVGLAAMGWQVDVVEAYRTAPVTVPPDAINAVQGADAVTFTSSSTVDRFVHALGMGSIPPAVVCIGPVTAATALAHGMAGVVVADEHTLDGVVNAVIGVLGSQSAPRAGQSLAGDP